MRVLGWQTPARNEGKGTPLWGGRGGRPSPISWRGCTIDRSAFYGRRVASEHICWDPKDGELCLRRAKPGETLVEARSDSDVQIDRQIWV